MAITEIDKLVEVMRRLRAPGGCPWDREQTRETLKPMLIEEAYEVLQALDEEDPEELREELGDLLLQIVFHAQIGEERGEFDLQGVIDGIQAKIIRRHPHVFGDVAVADSREVLVNWDRIKREEHAGKNKPRESVLDGISPGLPALYEAYQLGVRAARSGLEWDKAEDILHRLRAELADLENRVPGGEIDAIKDEIGDLLFTIVHLCRFLRLDPETSLKRTNQKFRERFQHVEGRVRQQERSLQDVSRAELEKLWRETGS